MPVVLRVRAFLFRPAPKARRAPDRVSEIEKFLRASPLPPFLRVEPVASVPSVAPPHEDCYDPPMTAKHPVSILAAVVAAAVVSAPQVSRPEAQAASTAFVGVNVLPMDKDAVLADQTVVVSDGKIVSVAPAAKAQVPAGALKVDGKGKFLMPGLGELHAHIPGGKSPDADVERTLFLYVANGVTTIRGMLGDPRHITYRERVAKGEVIGPMIYTSGPSFNGNSAKTPAAAVEMVVAQKQAGYDLLKIHPGVPRDAFDAMAAKADELKIPFAGHVPRRWA